MCFIELFASDLCDTGDGSGMITVRGPEGGDLPPSTPPSDCSAPYFGSGMDVARLSEGGDIGWESYHNLFKHMS